MCYLVRSLFVHLARPSLSDESGTLPKFKRSGV
jgi:hypothetical protein